MVYFTCVATAIQFMVEMSKDQSTEEQMWGYTIAFLVINVCSLVYFIGINCLQLVKLRDRPDMSYEEFKARLERRRIGATV